MELTLQIPVAIPSPERMEELYREACAAALERRAAWLTLDEAAEYLRMSRRTLDRHRLRWGLPVAELGGCRIVLRADLDAAVKAHLAAHGTAIVPFPSRLPAAVSSPADAAA